MDDVVKLLDFGLVLPVAQAGEPRRAAAGEGRVLGTPMFMSPEQSRGDRDLDERSDIYSMGAVAYYLLTGRPPFDRGGSVGVMLAHAHEPVVPPSSLRPDIPEDLERVVLCCLAKDSAHRFPDAVSLEHALGDCACAADWDQDRATRWWHDAGRSPDPEGVEQQSPGSPKAHPGYRASQIL
jgi:serine/threonine protein kinase